MAPDKSCAGAVRAALIVVQLDAVVISPHSPPLIWVAGAAQCEGLIGGARHASEAVDLVDAFVADAGWLRAPCCSEFSVVFFDEL